MVDWEDMATTDDGTHITLEPKSHGILAVQNESGSISCIVASGWIGCETPAANWPPREDGERYHSVVFSADGSVEWTDGQLGNTPREIVTYGATYHGLGWTIAAYEEGLIFHNDTTGKKFHVNPEAVHTE